MQGCDLADLRSSSALRKKNIIIGGFNRYLLVDGNRNLLRKLMISLQTVGKESQTVGPYGREHTAAIPSSTNNMYLYKGTG
jgi:hypothetical protein